MVSEMQPTSDSITWQQPLPQAQNATSAEKRSDKQIRLSMSEANGLKPEQNYQQRFASRKDSTMQRALTKFDRKRRDLTSRLGKRLSRHSLACDDVGFAERQNSVSTRELFKYAELREQVSICLGILFMVYAASWQPISVFILATMASLMGQYSKQISWLNQVTNSSGGGMANVSIDDLRIAVAPIADDAKAPANITADYASLSLLKPLYSFVKPIFDLGINGQVDRENIKAAIHDIKQHESTQFLRRSFEINGSAFALALTQLLAFFIGMTLITWAAKRQASRVKILYFRSCLHQEVTWFEAAADSASGSGSSLNVLVEKYEDGIGMKLALLCYFLGHVALFAMTAFYQMFRLAAFCMPFVLVVGLVIAYLSEWQAVAIGQHALFAKRSLQLAEEIIASIRTVFAFNGQQKEISRYSLSLQPVYRKSLIKHLYTALNTSLSKFSIFAGFAAYCFYAMRLFPPYNNEKPPPNNATVLAVMRGAEVSIVNILISIPFMEALQQSRGSIARIYATIERRSKIDPTSARGARPSKWLPSISFRLVQFGYADRQGPMARRRSTLAGAFVPKQQQQLSATSKSSQLDSPLPTLMPPPPPPPSGRSRSRSLADELAAVGSESAAVDQQRTFANSVARKAIANSIALRSSAAAVADTLAPRKPARASPSTFPPSQTILDSFNLDIKAGQSVALVGPSGSGKSTVLALVQRLYDITGGQLLIGQHNIKDLSVSWLRNQIGVVTQEPRLFDMSIADNIRLGLRDDTSSADDCGEDNDAATAAAGDDDEKRQSRIMQQVVAAAREAGAHKFISRLPNGYDTRVGSGGFQLSGGQKQRIAIARALIRQPKILLLDEATSALDSESEAQVQAALRAAGVGRTTLTVAHRLDTIKHVDLIVVMNQGRVVECGSHEELMSRERSNEPGNPGMYRQMYEAQLTIGKGAAATTTTGASGRRPLTGKEMKKKICRGDSHDAKPSARSCKLSARQSKDTNTNTTTTTTTTTVSPEWMMRQKMAGLSVGHSTTKGAGDLAGDKNTNQNALSRIEFEMPDDNNLPGDNDNGDDTDNSININENDYGYKDDDNENGDKNISVEDNDYHDDDDDDNDSSDDGSSSSSSSSSSSAAAGAWQLWQFIEMPKWSSLAAAIVCLVAGLILPMNLIAHSYLFAAFAYEEPDQIGDYLHAFGLVVLSFSTIVFIVSFLQVLLPGYVGEKLSTRLRVKTMDSLLSKPMFYFDMESNSAGSLCDRFNGYISNLQSIAGTRAATMIEAVSTLAAGALFGFGQNVRLSLFCLSFALLVLFTTIIESRIVQRESSLLQKFDAQLAHLMADALSNIKTIASLNKETFFIDRFSDIIQQREVGSGYCTVWLRTLLTSLKFVMPALSWSASMYYGCHLLVDGRIDLQTIFIVCPVVLFAVNDTFRALVFLPELLKARKSVERLYWLCREFSPEVLQTLSLAQQLEQQNWLHLEQATGAEALAPAAAQQRPTTKPSISINQAEAAAAPPAATTVAKMPQVVVNLHPDDCVERRSADAAADPDDPLTLAEENARRAAQMEQRRLSSISALPSYMRRKSSRLNSLVPSSKARGQIEFRDVEFAYPNRPGALVLDGFSLSVAPGESVALVGGSGSGKSTCVAILEKFYDFHAGRVAIDGQDLRLIRSDWARSQIGLVSQEPTLLSYTIGDNIRYGDNGRFVSMDEVVAAARTANIHEFIMSLPDQYDTELSTSAAYSSCQLSGGQRQRIAIARALIRNAPILVFDEATSALDTSNESVVQDALDKARRGRTSLTIAHRLATVKDADKIAVLSEGKVVEVGTHESLMEAPTGHYRKLWERQEGGAATATAAAEAAVCANNKSSGASST